MVKTKDLEEIWIKVKTERTNGVGIHTKFWVENLSIISEEETSIIDLTVCYELCLHQHAFIKEISTWILGKTVYIYNMKTNIWLWI